MVRRDRAFEDAQSPEVQSSCFCMPILAVEQQREVVKRRREFGMVPAADVLLDG